MTPADIILARLGNGPATRQEFVTEILNHQRQPCPIPAHALEEANILVADTIAQLLQNERIEQHPDQCWYRLATSIKTVKSEPDESLTPEQDAAVIASLRKPRKAKSTEPALTATVDGRPVQVVRRGGKFVEVKP